MTSLFEGLLFGVGAGVGLVITFGVALWIGWVAFARALLGCSLQS